MSQNTMSQNKSPIIVATNSEPDVHADAAEIRDVLNEFYKLKSKYEMNFYDKFLRPIISSKTKSKREKKIDYSKLPKPECVNCKRNVGSIFTIKNIKDDFKRLFTAKCGDIADPCPFNIIFEIADKQQLDFESVLINKELNDIKTDIVKGKNDIMFRYIEQNKAIARFNVTTEELKEKTEMAGYIINTNITINDNPKVVQLINQLETEFGENLLIPFKNMIKEHSEDIVDRSKMVEAITFYKDEMMPKIAEIQRLKYKTDYIDFKPVAETGDKTDLYVLVQRKNSLASLEFNFFSEDKLISNIKGVYENKGELSTSASAKARTMKNREPTKKGTRKNRPLVELVEEESVVPVAPILEEEKELEVVAEAEPEVVAEAEVASTTVNAEDAYRKEYDYTFSQLSPKYQKILSEDEAWLRKTINSFIEFKKLKKAGKTSSNADREFVHPDGLLLPPTQISEDRYDYGHPVYNQILNPDNKIIGSSQIKILHTYLEPMTPIKIPGQKPMGQYDQYLATLASLISSVVGFTKY
jgi:hypothetical protein